MEAATQAGVPGASSDRITIATRVLGGVLGVGYVVSGITGAALDAPGGGSDLFWWLLLLVGGGVLVLAGTLALASRPVVSAVVTILGAVAGTLALFWSVVAPVLAIVLATLTVVRALRASRGR